MLTGLDYVSVRAIVKLLFMCETCLEFLFFKQKTAYEMRISDWSSDVCSSDLFVLSFTVETDGRLPTGDPLGAAIEAVDAATGSYPAYYMINCAHPTHFAATLDQDADWVLRVRGIRANASR